MPEFSTFIRDFGIVPTIISVGIIALIVFSIVKGGSKGKGGGSKNSGGGSSAPPPTTSAD